MFGTMVPGSRKLIPDRRLLNHRHTAPSPRRQQAIIWHIPLGLSFLQFRARRILRLASAPVWSQEDVHDPDQEAQTSPRPRGDETIIDTELSWITPLMKSHRP